MALRLFRRSRKLKFMSEIQVCPLEMSGMEQLCAGLSEEDIENLSTFRVEANIIKARSSDESIGISEALRYLRATKFNSSKAVEIFRNYNKHRESYQLDNLRPHRNPLCMEIGSRKLEIVGTVDSEGSPIVVFTVARHDMKSSDHKAAMQLVFYTLDQIAESEPEHGVVVIMDMRDISITSFDVRYVTNILSVLREGYPILIKAIYIVNSPIWIRTQVALSKALKQDINKIQFVNANDLCPKYFSASELPHSLGGSYVPGIVTQRGAPSTKPPPPPSSSRLQHSSDGVNLLVKAFEKGHLSTSTASTTSSVGSGPGPARPQPPSAQLKPKPTPLARSSRGIPAPATAPRKPSSGNSDTSRNEHSRQRIPLLPRVGNKSLVTSPSQQTKALQSISPSVSGRGGSPAQSSMVKDHSVGGVGGGSVVSQIKSFEKKSANDERFGSSRESASSHADNRARSGSSSGQASGPLQQINQGSPNRIKRPLIPVRLLSADSVDSHREKRSKDSSNTGGDSGHSSHHTNVAMATKNPRVPPPNTHIQHVHNVSPYASSTVTMANTKQTCSYDNGEYENVEFKQESPTGRGHQQAPPTLTSYENVVVKPQQRPRPSLQQPPIPASDDSYENVDFTCLPPQTSQRNKGSTQLPCPPSDEHVSDDDDVLFGKEGPPGMRRDEVIYENFGPDAGNKYMSIDELEKHILKHDKKGLSAEYLKIKNEPLCGTYKASRLRCNLTKNRYKDVVCYDETRVVLKTITGVEGSDYIHANYVSGYNKPQAFILTQGPKDKTVVDFWRLVWEKNVRVLVMITKCVEIGKRKCSQYWPESVDSDPVSHGHVTIQLTKTISEEGYDIHTLKVSSMGVERTIIHYQFLAWPDYGVPSSGQEVLQLLFVVRKAQSRLSQHMDLARLNLPPDGPPILIHCSAGVGRSGAFCTLDVCIDELKDKGVVNLQGIVRRMRTERAYSVQTDEQYEFCYRTILEYAKSTKFNR